MCSGGAKYISAHGHSIPDLLEAIMKLFPLDTYNYSKNNFFYKYKIPQITGGTPKHVVGKLLINKNIYAF